MFNIFLSKEENRKLHYYPPKNFVQLDIQPDLNLMELPYMTGGCHRSVNFSNKADIGFFRLFFNRNIESNIAYRNSTFTFESISTPKHPGGGILVLPKGCSKHSLSDRLMNVGSNLRNGYLATFVDSWYEPDNYEDGAPVYENGSLALIHTSYYQTNVWSAAVLRQKKHRPGQSYAKLTCIDPGAQIYSWEWDSHSMETNIGSSSKNVGDIKCTVAVQVLSLHRQGRLSRFKDSFARLLRTE
ncbi:hypothetical protein JR316_0004039 [Psilocybe cubensis]|uniref:Uncharacterized protein n=1 Tax=Psilocybe cubensis TaxID=181762 RepID=A0ACB8HA81_PSICU|nr:hypothetical protein JR316_0004039 [Psilocybe cubensis]KAH9484557.1 hypothetical protein JR316_0004039 [Psilocybe cubensis]